MSLLVEGDTPRFPVFVIGNHAFLILLLGPGSLIPLFQPVSRWLVSKELLDSRAFMAKPDRPTAAAEASVEGARFLILEARFYDKIGELLRAGAEQALKSADARFDVIAVPGALEIPIALSIALDAASEENDPYQGVVVLGCVIRGETYHFEIVAGESARALMDLAVSRKLALGNGILTVENEAQALVRAGDNQGDKGGDAARAALALYRLKARLGAL